MTKEQVIEYAKANSLRYTEEWPQSSIQRRKTWTEYAIGIELKPSVWYWWFTFSVKEEMLFFRERYNQNNGAVQRSFHRGFEAQFKITQYLKNQTK